MNRRDEMAGPVLDLLDEAVHVTRRAPAAALLAYYAGTAPFVLAALFFWSDMSRSAFAEQRLIRGATLLTFLFAWMKTWQVIFAAKLRAAIVHEPPPGFSPRQCLRIAIRQLCLQPSGLFLLPVAMIIMLPAGWLIAVYQSAVALGAHDDDTPMTLLKRSWRAARVDPLQNHTALLIFFIFGMFVFFNIALLLISAPFLLKLLTGVETPITMNVGTALNTTFLITVCGLTYLCLDPLMKAFYLLRAFYAESRQTGEDLRVRARSIRKTAAAALAALWIIMAAPTSAPAAPAAPPRPDSATELDRTIDRVLSRREYAWRTPRQKRTSANAAADRLTLWERVAQWGRRTMKSFTDWLNKMSGRRSGRGGAASGFSFFSGIGLAYLLIGLVLVIVVILLVALWRTRERRSREEREAAPVTAAPDLADENVGAEQLPKDSWMTLAMELMARGELRLALRALYLASLAHLAERNLITLARFKSNRDYEREVVRRSHALPELSRAFSENVSAFDRVWYGTHEASAELLDHFRMNVERIQSC